MDEVTREQWAEQFLHRMGYPATRDNMVALIAWQAAEGGPQSRQAKWNPLNTTKRMTGSTNFNELGGGVGVQNYVSRNQGLAATKQTLLEHGHGYGRIRRALKAGDQASEALKAVEDSAWGTGGLAASIEDDVRRGFDAYGSQPIGQ